MNRGRSTLKLNLDWKFFKGDDPRSWYKGFDDSDWQNVTVPHDWSVAEPFSREYSSGTGYLPGGTGWYRKTFYLPEEAKGKKVYITFEGVYNNAQVWCNSYYIGKRPYGYSTFTYDLTDFVSFGDVKNVVAVKVNHKDIADSRWFTGSGIYRDVYVTITNLIHFDNYGVFVTMPEVSSRRATVNVRTRISNETRMDAEVRIRTYLVDKNGRTVAETQTARALQGGAETEKSGAGTETEQQIRIADPRLWSPDSPYLYTLVTEIVESGKTVDLVKTPTGIRRFEFDADKGFFLNGVNMKIKGVCVHHDAGCLGAAVPEKVWIRRLEYLKEMGCNAVRMSHNPPVPYLLDLCDQMGFLAIDEAFDEWEGVKNKWTAGHNVYPPSHFGYYEEFPQWGETDIKEMVLRDRNHPSVILWSIGNEVDYPNDPYCHPSFHMTTGNNDAAKPEAERVYDPDRPNAERLVTVAKRLARFVKECDATRPVTAAVAFPELSNLTGYTDVLDVVGYNYKEHLYGQDHIKYPGKVLYGSENIPSLDAWLAVRDNDYICGQFVWTGIDFMGEAKGWPVRISQSGFLDVAGYKKPGYYYRQSLWSSKPMVYLTSRVKSEARAEDKADGRSEDRRGFDFGEAHWNRKAGERVEALCYTNCEEAELFINGRSLGVRRLEDFPQSYLVWEMDYEAGKLEVFAKNGDGIGCSCELNTVDAPKKLSMSADASELAADGTDIAHVDVTVTDGSGREVYLAEHLIKLSIEGPGEILGMENGDAGDLEPYRSRRRKAYHGRLLAYIRTKRTAGTIVIKAEAEGLEPAEIEINTKAVG